MSNPSINNPNNETQTIILKPKLAGFFWIYLLTSLPGLIASFLGIILMIVLIFAVGNAGSATKESLKRAGNNLEFKTIQEASVPTTNKVLVYNLEGAITSDKSSNVATLNQININPSQFAGIISAMNSYNQLPTEVKDGSMQAIQSLGQSEIVKTEERNQAELTDKIAQVLVGSLKVEAGGCSNQYYNWGMYWWGVRLRTSKCFGEDLKNTGAISSYGSQLAGGFCIVASVLAGAGVISCGLFMAIWWSVSWKMFTLGQAIIYNSDRCRQSWVTADIQYTSNFSVVC